MPNHKKYTRKQLQSLSDKELLDLASDKSLQDMSKESKRLNSLKSKPKPKPFNPNVSGQLLTPQQIYQIKKGTIPDGLMINGSFECMGEAGGPPCYWIPPIGGGGTGGYDDDDLGTEIFLECDSQQQGSTPNDNCPNGFVCYASGGYDNLCCPPGQMPSYEGSSPSGYTHMCIGANSNIQRCGDPSARNYNPTIPSSEIIDCVYCDPGNDLGYGSVWTDCGSFCTDTSRWGIWNGGTWMKGDLDRDGNTDYSNLVMELTGILQSQESSAYKACASWAADINDDYIINVEDTYGPPGGNLSQPLKVLTINAGHLYNIHDKKETPTSCDDPRCRRDDGFDPDAYQTEYCCILQTGQEAPCGSSGCVGACYECGDTSGENWGMFTFPGCCEGWTNMLESGWDFAGCSEGCTHQGLCRRVDEEAIRDFIDEQSPDIIVITELIGNQDEGYSCAANSCEQERLNPESSCYEYDTTYSDEQIDRVLPHNYTVSCNNPLYTCIAVKQNVGSIVDTYNSNQTLSDSQYQIHSSEQFELPNECYGMDSWPINVSAANIVLNNGFPLQVVGAHPKQMIEQNDDACRKAHLEHAFSTDYFYSPSKNMIVAGDFNIDPYKLDVQKWWGWENMSDVNYMADWLKDKFNNWTTPPNFKFQVDVPTCGEYTFRMWDMVTSVRDITFTLQDAEGNQIQPGNYLTGNYNQNSEYFDLGIGIDFDELSLKVCADDAPGPDHPFCVRVPRIEGCYGLSATPYNINNDIEGYNYIQPTMTGGRYIYIRYHQNGDITIETPEWNFWDWLLGTECVAGGCPDFTFDANEDGTIFDNLISGVIYYGISQIQDIMFDKVADLSPINYNTVSTGLFVTPDDSAIDSGEYIIQNAGTESENKNFVWHNLPETGPQDSTMSFLSVENMTFDHIMSNFASSGGCETFEFPFMDHHALICTLNPMGSYQRGGRTKKVERTKPVPTRNTTFNVDTTLQRGVHPETGWYYQQSTQQYFIAPGQIIVADSYWPEQGDAVAFFWNGVCVGWSYVGDIQESQVGGDWYVNAGIPIMIFDGWVVNDNDPMYEYPHNYSSVFPNGRFKYYKASTGQILDLVPPQEYCTEFANYPIINGEVDILNEYGPWLALETLNLEQHCPNIPTPYFTWEMEGGWNLISFPIESFMNAGDVVDNTIETIYSEQDNPNRFPDQFIGQGNAATFHNNMWVGSLTELNPMEGYWAHCPNWESGCVITTFGQPIGSPDYTLVPGANLISYPHSWQMEADMLLGWDGQGWASSYIKGFVGDGEALIFREEEDRWVGNLTHFKPNKAYWLIRSDESVTTFKWVYQGTSEAQTQRADVQYRQLTFPDNWNDMGIENVFNNLSEQIKSKPSQRRIQPSNNRKALNRFYKDGRRYQTGGITNKGQSIQVGDTVKDMDST